MNSNQLAVERRMLRGDRFSDVEDEINAMPVDEHGKAALWLLAWSYVHPRAQRREALAHLERACSESSPPVEGRILHLVGRAE